MFGTGGRRFGHFTRHRNRELVTLIMKAAFEDLAKRGYRHVFNLSAGLVTVMGSLAMGWKSAGTLDPIGLRKRRGLPSPPAAIS